MSSFGLSTFTVFSYTVAVGRIKIIGPLSAPVQSSVKNIPARFREWLAAILCQSAILWSEAEHFEIGT